MSPRYDTKYCEHCDETTAEWGTGAEGEDTCPTCGGSLYDSYEDYAEEMIRWLDERYDMDEGDVVAFLTKHGNPGKGQAAAIIDREGFR